MASAWELAQAEAGARWPGLKLSVDELRAHAARVGAGDEPPPHARDLALACALLRGDRVALRVFEGELVPGARASIARVHPAADFVDEVCQELRRKLLVGPPPRLELFTGASPLEGWVRVTAVRLAYDVGRADHFRLRDDEGALDEVADSAIGPELLAVKRTIGPAFQEALRAALDALTPRQRNVLRMHLADGLSIDEIAAPYGVHRATAARWLNEARAAVTGGVRERVLAQHPRLGSAELDSLAALVASQLHLSLARLAPMRTDPGSAR